MTNLFDRFFRLRGPNAAVTTSLSPPAPTSAHESVPPPVGPESETLEAFAPPAGTLFFRCNVCSAYVSSMASSLDREVGACTNCRSNVRFRGVVYALALRMFGQPLAIADFPENARGLRGIGMSDTGIYADLLPKQTGYVNTYYHQEPRLDIQNPGAEHLGCYDFVISSDVLEHVAPPVSTAFMNLRLLLRPGGLLVLTVPFSMEGETVEHYPELHDFRVDEIDGQYVLFNRTSDGREQRFADLVFHGGPGSTLEMRVFSEASLRRELEQAGFTDVRFHREACFESGIVWLCPWSVPITAVAA